MTHPQKNPNQFTFWEHVDEVRLRVLRLLAVVTILACIIYAKSSALMDFFIRPVGKLVFTSPSEAFMARVTLVLVLSIILSMPFIAFELWTFTATALKEGERKIVALLGPLSIVCFFAGCVFAYVFIVPFSLKFFMSFATDTMVPMITVNNYISFVATMMLAFGVIFELPLALMFFTYIGIATPAFLIQYRRHAIMVILIVSTIVTPPDGMTLVMMSVPLIILYEVGILFSKLVYQRSLKTQLPSR